jgi:hypothetical protein
MSAQILDQQWRRHRDIGAAEVQRRITAEQQQHGDRLAESERAHAYGLGCGYYEISSSEKGFIFTDPLAVRILGKYCCGTANIKTN